ncbi:hypothetical protein MLD38_020384 [Melastoma candidum]|uniref:Uncharacterized protein n=1 Tax=Melastoma candidum TaxID=119954 RepID=A0ACB9QKT5_9MYRT|nr:hypothetical protein MLD38_020384 [Melastoma candidum]
MLIVFRKRNNIFLNYLECVGGQKLFSDDSIYSLQIPSTKSSMASPKWFKQLFSRIDGDGLPFRSVLPPLPFGQGHDPGRHLATRSYHHVGHIPKQRDVLLGVKGYCFSVPSSTTGSTCSVNHRQLQSNVMYL